MKKVFVTPEYFRKGDYTDWYEAEVPEVLGEMSYEEYLERELIPRMEMYQTIVLYEDGTLYGVIGGKAEQISDREFNPETEKHIFDEVFEEYAGIQGDLEREIEEEEK
jgi:hypothetical protein